MTAQELIESEPLWKRCRKFDKWQLIHFAESYHKHVERLKKEGMKKLLELLATHGGKIVSTNDLTVMEINQARASNRMYVDEDSLGYVWLPPFFGRFPVTVEEVEMYEWCYPIEIELPKELEDIDFERLKKEFMKDVNKRGV